MINDFTPFMATQDYVQDGIIFCGNCRSPKQTLIVIQNEEKLVPCLCDCAEARRNAILQAEKEQQRAIRISQLRAEGIQDRNVRGITFVSAAECPIIEKARRYVAVWRRMLAQNVGLLLWGDTSVGKTYAAACIANALIDKGVPVMMTSFPRILAELQNIQISKTAFIDNLVAYDFLIIDDFGVERQSEFAMEQIFSVLDARDKSGKPLIVTTNMRLSDLKNPPGTAKKRIYERLLSMTVPIFVGGDNRRQSLGNAKKEALKLVLKGDMDNG